MKSFLKNVGVLSALLLTLTLSILADTSSAVPQIKQIDSKFIINGKEAIDPRSIEKIDTMGNELFVKTGISVYIYASEQYSKNEFGDMKQKMEFIKSFESTLLPDLEKPYILLTLSLEDKHVNVLSSKRVEGIVNRDEILDSYIIPLLASHDKNSKEAKVSAALLNGYSAVVEMLADAKGVKVESIINGSGRTFAKVWKIFMYLIVLGGLLAYMIAIWRDKRKHK